MYSSLMTRHSRTVMRLLHQALRLQSLIGYEQARRSKEEAPAGGTTGAKDGRLGGLWGWPSVHNSAYALASQFSNWPAPPR